MPSAPLQVPQTKPATELIDGRLARKTSPFGVHAQVQRFVASRLGDWADEKGRGRVGTEWDFDLTPPGGAANRLVPDVAYLSYERVAYEDREGAQVPTVAPNVAVEILSPGQTRQTSARRTEILIACGCELVLLFDPKAEAVWLIDATGERRLAGDGVIEHGALPGFKLAIRRCFELVPPGGHAG